MAAPCHTRLLGRHRPPDRFAVYLLIGQHRWLIGNNALPTGFVGVNGASRRAPAWPARRRDPIGPLSAGCIAGSDDRCSTSIFASIDVGLSLPRAGPRAA